ncbi:LysR family transcriptional regulator substrate-binding protein, partial [Frankia sp. Cpl3]|nr:LysR family transcriptional regulator substrate-binding protein [Frankia sp. Cpl3]
MLDQARENLSEECQLEGTLTIGTVESLAAFFLPPILQTFRREHPRIKVLLHPGICHDLRNGVREGIYDFAVILDRLHTHPDLTCINLGQEELVVIAAPDHRLSKQERVETTDFAGENWIFTEAGCRYRAMMEHLL